MKAYGDMPADRPASKAPLQRDCRVSEIRVRISRLRPSGIAGSAAPNAAASSSRGKGGVPGRLPFLETLAGRPAMGM
jgi:hypothetical protein